jgi:Lrp/AsnC family leucine-responsive transcriptional regulator
LWWSFGRTQVDENDEIRIGNARVKDYKLAIWTQCSLISEQTNAMTTLPLDTHDLALLRLLQEDASVSQRSLAEKVNLSAAAVQRRIAKLEQNGVIRQTVAIVDPAKVGFPITVMVEVTLRDDRAATVAEAKRFFREATEVQQCYWAAGVAGIILIMAVPTLEAYEVRTAGLFGENDLVKSYRTVVLLDKVKVGLSVPF